MQISVTAATAALCGLLLVVLAARITVLRIRHKVALGDGGVSTLVRAIRAHANTTEYVPIFLLLSLCYELYVGSTRALIAVDSSFVFARLIFAYGLSRRSVHPGRRVGAALTYATVLALALMLGGAVLTRSA
jgi:uncharacterized membrane protein YecN with MAPEG domain